MSIGVPGLNSVRNHFFLLREDDDWCTGTQFCHESYFFNCGRQTIGVPGLNSVMNDIFIAGGKRLVYRDSTLSWIRFFFCGRQTIGVPGLNSIMKHFFYCGRKTITVPGLISEWIIYFLCDSFLLREDDNRCTGTRFNFLVWRSVYCGRQTISVPGLNFFIRIQPRIVFIEGSWGHVTKKGCQKAIINFTRKHR
jgi:hypothetical protein